MSDDSAAKEKRLRELKVDDENCVDDHSTSLIGRFNPTTEREQGVSDG